MVSVADDGNSLGDLDVFSLPFLCLLLVLGTLIFAHLPFEMFLLASFWFGLANLLFLFGTHFSLMATQATFSSAQMA